MSFNPLVLFYFLKLMEQQRRKGLWEECLRRVQPGQRVGRLKLPHRVVSLYIHITYCLCLFIYICFTWLNYCCFNTTISFCKMSISHSEQLTNRGCGFFYMLSLLHKCNVVQLPSRFILSVCCGCDYSHDRKFQKKWPR